MCRFHERGNGARWPHVSRIALAFVSLWIPLTAIADHEHAPQLAGSLAGVAFLLFGTAIVAAAARELLPRYEALARKGGMSASIPRLGSATALAIAAALAVCSSASADLRVFRVTAEGSGSYSRYDDSRAPGVPIGVERRVAISFGWQMTIPHLIVDSVGNAQIAGQLRAIGSLTGGGSDAMVIHGQNGGVPVQTRGDCSAPDDRRSAVGSLRPDAAPGGERGAYLVFRPFDPLSFDATCTGSLAHAASIGVASVGPNPFDQRFFLPKLATDQGKVIVHVDRDDAREVPCPGIEVTTKSCSLSWSGKLTFDLVENTQGPPALEDVFIPMPGGDAAEPSATPPTLEDLFIPMPGGGAEEPSATAPAAVHLRARAPRVTRSAGRASVMVACRTACTGTVRAFAVGLRRSARVSARALAIRRFRIAAGGGKKRVTVPFAGRARRAVRRAAAVRLVIEAGQARSAVVARVPRHGGRAGRTKQGARPRTPDSIGKDMR